MESLFSHMPTGDASASQPPPDDALLTSGGGAEERTTPTDRASLQRQIAVVLRAASMSGAERSTIASVDVARVEGVTPETATQTLRFCCSARLFTGGRGKFTVTDTGLAFARRWAEDETHARLQLQAQFLAHWATAEAAQALQPGPLPVNDLAQRLQGDLPGSRRRGVNLVEWLALVMLVHRDQQNLVWPAPALSAMSGLGATLSVPRDAAVERIEDAPEEPHSLMGMANSELRSLPRERYSAMLKHLNDMVNELTPA